MSNASRCQQAAARYGLLAESSPSADEQNEYRELARLWSAMARFAERFDHQHDAAAKARIYAMMGQVESVRRKHALSGGMFRC